MRFLGCMFAVIVSVILAVPYGAHAGEWRAAPENSEPAQATLRFTTESAVDQHACVVVLELTHRDQGLPLIRRVFFLSAPLAGRGFGAHAYVRRVHAPHAITGYVHQVDGPVGPLLAQCFAKYRELGSELFEHAPKVGQPGFREYKGMLKALEAAYAK